MFQITIMGIHYQDQMAEAQGEEGSTTRMVLYQEEEGDQINQLRIVPIEELMKTGVEEEGKHEACIKVRVFHKNLFQGLQVKGELVHFSTNVKQKQIRENPSKNVIYQDQVPFQETQPRGAYLT